MVLKDSLYQIIAKEELEDTLSTYECDFPIVYSLSLNYNHFVYQAHFPGEPITPGACIIQIAKELFEDHMKGSYTIRIVKNVKFLSVISSTQTPRLDYVFEKMMASEESGEYKVQVQVRDATSTFAKLSLVFSPCEYGGVISSCECKNVK